ncbi:hypothetical protein OAS39_06410 [Pirellulales bacterium]|nr:hypothetical protein [Pirellulales bacterium]
MLHLRQAIREGWDVPDAVRPLIISDLCTVMDAEEKPRLAAAAVRCIVVMESENQAAEHAHLQRPWQSMKETRSTAR